MNWIFGNNINTDLITPGRFNITTNPQELARVAFIEHRPEFAKQVKSGDFVIAGHNFGCGSSRETAVTALKYSKIKAVVAQSFARIFYRNALNQGLLVLVADTSQIKATDNLKLDFKHHQIVNQTQGSRITFQMPAVMMKLYQANGIIEYIKKHGLDSIEDLFIQKDI